jgi:hypothetical protein
VQHPHCCCCAAGPPARGSAQPDERSLPRPFFIFQRSRSQSDDALIATGQARRAKSQELFGTGAEKVCFDGLTVDERAGWARAVDYFAEIVTPFAINAREQILFRIELLAGSDWATVDDRIFMAIARNIRAAGAR